MPDSELPQSLTISCADCPMRRTNACYDCVVTYLCVDSADDHGTDGFGTDDFGTGASGTGDPYDQLTLNGDELRTVQLFRRARMVPSVRHPRHLDAVR